MKNMYLALMLLLAASCSTPAVDDSDDETGNGNTNIIETTPGSPITDVNGNVYQTIKIGTQTWMAENLRATKFRNSGYIMEAQNNADWSGTTYLTQPKYCKYNNNADSSSIYGMLYDGITAYHASNIAPTGWRIPTSDDWNTLINYLGGSSVAGGKMKEIGFTHWVIPNTGADNASGFKALGSGYRFVNGTFSGIRGQATWWVGNNTGNCLTITILYNAADVRTGNCTSQLGYSIRCVKE